MAILKEDVNEKRIEWMEKALMHYSANYEFTRTEECWIPDLTIDEFDPEDQETIRFLDRKALRGGFSRGFDTVLMFGLIELIQAYEAEGYTKEQFLNHTKICEYNYDMAKDLIKRYKEEINPTPEPKIEIENPIIDKCKSLLDGAGLNGANSNTGNTKNNKGGKGSTGSTT